MQAHSMHQKEIKMKKLIVLLLAALMVASAA